jgi:hypothetical protein
MIVNVLHKHVLFYLFYWVLEEWEGEINNYHSWPSKSIPLKIMREKVKRKMKGEERRNREG